MVYLIYCIYIFNKIARKNMHAKFLRNIKADIQNIFNNTTSNNNKIYSYAHIYLYYIFHILNKCNSVQFCSREC